MSENQIPPVSRRTFVQTTIAAAAAIAVRGGVHAQGSDAVRVGVIGTGGRGSGAATDVIRSSQGVEIVALGDLTPDRLGSAREHLAKFVSADPKYKGAIKVTDDTCFTGFDAYKRVLASNVDYVILSTPPGFRPMQLAAAVDAGKHIFTEKPVAVDSNGIRSVLDTYERARAKNLGIGVGTQRRHQRQYLETIQRIQDGAIGTVVSGQVFWNQGGLWNHARQPNWSDTEWQIRNWLYFTWLSGDHIVEQHVHNIDVANWVLGAHPVRATAVGGRQWRTEPRYGHIYDHFGVDFEYPNGQRVLSMCRQINGTRGRIGEQFLGSTGSAEMRNEGTSDIRGAASWSFEPKKGEPTAYVQEHTDLVASIRSGKPYNELKQVAESTLSAILGREAAYTGQELTWDEVLNAQQDLMPPQAMAFGPLEVPPVPMPGRTKLARKWNE